MRFPWWLLLLLPGLAHGYPLDGEAYTGIGRLEGYRLALEGKVRARVQPPGGRLGLQEVDLRLAGKDIALPQPDAAFSREVGQLLGNDADRYAIAVLDLSDPSRPVYAEHRADVRFNPGSVGKLVVVTALFQLLADLHPGDIAARERVLRQAKVVADGFIVHDGHVVPFWDGRRLSYRPLRVGDAASLWTYLDWMLSASSNAAASMVMRETLLLAHYGREYPVDEKTGTAFFRTTPKKELAALLERVMTAGVVRNGLDPQGLRQGSFFTHAGKSRVPGGGSWATPRELVRWLLDLEEGRIVDAWSSREIKRLLYMTQRRIRYASSPALNDAAVYFKSGSLYRCRPEPGFVCRKYQGNVENLLNSVAIVEYPAKERRLHYLVVVSSNVLKVNSAVAHQTLATRLQRLLEQRHPAAAPLARGQGLGGGVEHGFVQAADEVAQPLASLGVFRQGHGDVAAAVPLDDGAVRMPVPPGTGLAVDAGVGMFPFQALDELVVDPGVAQDGFHLGCQLGRQQAPGLQQVVEAAHLQCGGAVGDVVQGVPHGFAALAVGPAHPQAAVALGVVEAIDGGAQQVGQIVHSHPAQHLAGGAVGRHADHAGQGVPGLVVQLHVAGLDVLEGPQQDGDLGQAGGIDHVIGVDGREAGVLRVGDVGHGHRQALFAYGLVQAQAIQVLFQLGLQPGIDGTIQLRPRGVGRSENGGGNQGQGKAEQQSCQMHANWPPGSGLIVGACNQGGARLHAPWPACILPTS
jgi:hypothetical protein